MRAKLILALAVLAVATAAQADDLDKLIAGIQSRYAKTKDLTVDFEQTMSVKQMGNREQKANGVIYLARPNKMRWVYKSAPAKEIITDGASLVTYYVDEKKAYLAKPGAAFNVGLPMAILAGEVNIKSQYTPELAADENGRARVKLTPKTSLGFAYLVLSVERQGFLIDRIDVIDAYGNANKIELKNPRFNTKLPEGTFTFTPKPGVEIVDMPSAGLE
jgi:outer membrane lipoprotein carrier protein